MAERYQVYKCDICGNIVEVLHGGAGELVCCGQPMKLFTENTVDAAKEKHVPVIEKVDGGFKVKVGDVAHPMEEKHWIEFIEIIADGKGLSAVSQSRRQTRGGFHDCGGQCHGPRVLQLARALEGLIEPLRLRQHQHTPTRPGENAVTLPASVTGAGRRHRQPCGREVAYDALEMQSMWLYHQTGKTAGTLSLLWREVRISQCDVLHAGLSGPGDRQADPLKGD